MTVGSLATTYGSLLATVRGIDVMALPWPYWAMIGFTFFWVSMSILVYLQYLENRRLRSEDAKLERRKKKVGIRKMKLESEIDLETEE